MRRRDVVKLLAGATMVAPLRAAAQSARTYRLAMLTSGPAFPLQNPNVNSLGHAGRQGIQAQSKSGIPLLRRRCTTAPAAATRSRYCRKQGRCRCRYRLAASERDERHRCAHGRRRRRRRSGGDRPRRQPGAPRRQHHWHIGQCDDAQHQTSGAAQAGGADHSQGGDAVEQARPRHDAALSIMRRRRQIARCLGAAPWRRRA